MRDVYLDVDRTLFDTDAFDVLRWKFLEETYGVSAEKERARQREFYVELGGAETYDLAAHMEDIGIEADEVRATLRRSELVDGRLEYAGVGELVEWLGRHGSVKLLTFGFAADQEMKLALCPSLRGVEATITLESKDKFFMQHPEPAVLLDDKPIGGSLPPHVTFVQSAGYNGIVPPEDAPWPVVQSLTDFRSFLEEQYAA